MRDPQRIKPILARIEKLRLKNPDFRFGQLIIWLAKIEELNPKLFYLEDKEFLEKINELEKQFK